MKKTKNVRPLSFEDYQRLTRVIAGVLTGAKVDPSKSCVFFSIVGCLILNKFYGREARTVAGAAAYQVGPDASNRIVYGAYFRNDEKGQYLCHEGERFHCWIECDNYVIDLMAPYFREAIAGGVSPLRVARLMFQKLRAEMQPDFTKLKRSGEFHLVPDSARTLEVLDLFDNAQMNWDLAEICGAWFKPEPLDLPPFMGMANEDGEVQKLSLARLSLKGAW